MKEKLQLSKKWTISGLILLIGSFFMHPDACLAPGDLVNALLTPEWKEQTGHITMLVGTILTILGKGLFQNPEK